LRAFTGADRICGSSAVSRIGSVAGLTQLEESVKVRGCRGAAAVLENDDVD
jgi:hypothetical protein